MNHICVMNLKFKPLLLENNGSTLCLMLLVDVLIGSYGSTLRYKSVERLKPVGKHSLIGAGGEISDFQEIQRYLDELM